MAQLYLYNEKTGKRYDVVKFDKDKGEVTLKGQYGQFTEKFDKDKFINMGYTLQQEA